MIISWPTQKQRTYFQYYGENLLVAIRFSERLGDRRATAALRQTLGYFALSNHLYIEAEEHYTEYAKCEQDLGNSSNEAAAYHQLGNIKRTRRDYSSAEKWHHRSLEIKIKNGDTAGAANAYHSLGTIALERGDLDVAEKWHRKSVNMAEGEHAHPNLAIAYNNLAVIALKQGDPLAAEEWQLKALKLAGKIDNEHARLNDATSAQEAASTFRACYEQASTTEQTNLRSHWENAGNPWPEDVAEGKP